MINTTDPSLSSWVTIPQGSDFPIQNLPYGIFDDGQGARVGVAIGEHILDLTAVARLNGFDGVEVDVTIFSHNTLNAFMSCGKAVWTAVRQRISAILQEGEHSMQAQSSTILVPMAGAKMLLPAKIGDYTDFYSSIEHATNVGMMFRGKDNALMPNWKHLPVGYHGRASSIIVSGTDIHRPKGQTMPPNAEKPSFGPSKRMDFELEMAFLVGPSTELGDSVSTGNAEDHIFGFVLFNDWSARDIQKWEYVPLGPFLGKSFASSISPWVVTLAALEPFRVESPEQDPEVLPYLQCEGKHNFDINLQVIIQPENEGESVVCNSNYKYMYWNIAQQLTHHTVNGCNLNTGDMMASGTISGKTPDSYGSMLELSWAGKQDVALEGGKTRKFLEDNDTVIVRGHCEKEGLRIGFGEVASKLLPSK